MPGPIDRVGAGSRARGGAGCEGTGRLRRLPRFVLAPLSALLLLAGPLGGQDADEGDGQADDRQVARTPASDTAAVDDTASVRDEDPGEGGPGEAEAGEAGPVPVDPGAVPDSLLYRREVFEYRRAQRRDPFRPLEARETVGPRFEDLVVQGILYQPALGSVAVIVDRSLGDRYRVREGHRLGEARVLEIRRREVLFRIERFGSEQEEVLSVEKEDDEG